MQFYNKYMSSKPTSFIQKKNGLFDFIGDIFSSSTDEDIAQRNLNYQRERNRIEDARYEDETEYNRAFAEDERDYQRAFAEDERAYNRALQQQLFEREDTALERQANQLSKLGINPLTQQLNGLDSGQIVSSSLPTSSSAPSTSSRGGEALHLDYKPSDTFSKIATPIIEAINAVDNINTQGVQRDSLRAQTNYQNLLNESQAIENEFKRQELEESIKNKQADTANKEADTKGKNIDNSRNKRVDDFQEKTGLTDMNTGNLASLPNMAFAAEQTRTSMEKQKEDGENHFNGNPLTYTGDKLKDSFSIVGNAFANTFGKGAKTLFNYAKKGGSKLKNWFKHNSAEPEYMRDMYGF